MSTLGITAYSTLQKNSMLYIRALLHTILISWQLGGFRFHPAMGSENVDKTTYSSGMKNCSSLALHKRELKTQWDFF